MKRSLDFDQFEISCSRGHPSEPMRQQGFYALKEAGAPATILGLACPKCYRVLCLTEGPTGITAALAAEIDATP